MEGSRRRNAVHNNMIRSTTLKTKTATSAPTYEQYRDIRTSCIGGYRVNKATGEIYGKFNIRPFKSTLEIVKNESSKPVIQRSQQRDPTLTRSDSDIIVLDFPKLKPLEDLQKTSPAPSSRRGPKPNIRINSYADIIKQAVKEKLQWIENAVMAGVYIAAGSSNGKLNIRPCYIRKVITLPLISTEAIAQSTSFLNHDWHPVSDRYVRYLAAAGRTALDCIKRHLEANPQEVERLKAKAIAEAEACWHDEFDLDETIYLPPET